MVMHVVYIVVFKYTTVFLVFEWSPMTEHYQRSSLSLSDVWLLGNVTRYPYDLQSHESDDLSWCTVRRERAVNLAKEAVLVHRNLQTVARRGRTCHGDSAPNLSKVTSLWKMIEASLDFFRLCFFCFLMILWLRAGRFFTGDIITGVLFSVAAIDYNSSLCNHQLSSQRFPEMGGTPQNPPKIIDFKSDASLYYKPSSYWGTIDWFLWMFSGFSMDFYGFLWISMDFYGNLMASPPGPGEVWHGIQSSRLGGREAVQRLRGICDLDLNVNQASRGDFRAGDFRGISGWVYGEEE